jgi:hypothetical protein
MTKKEPFTVEQHYNALIRRRIKFVTEKGAMARLFKAGTNFGLQQELLHQLNVELISKVKTREEYDILLIRTVELGCWGKYSRHGIEIDRWGYFAKLINIIIYEIVSNRELFAEEDWNRIRPFLHIPIDGYINYHLCKIDPTFPFIVTLKGMTKEQYLDFQERTRKLGDRYGLPPIWFEAAWSQ